MSAGEGGAEERRRNPEPANSRVERGECFGLDCGQLSTDFTAAEELYGKNVDVCELVASIDSGREVFGFVKIEPEVPQMTGEMCDGTELDLLGDILYKGVCDFPDTVE